MTIDLTEIRRLLELRRIHQPRGRRLRHLQPQLGPEQRQADVGYDTDPKFWVGWNKEF
jgi:hypothetical protein